MTKSKSNGSAPASPEGARSASAGEGGAAAAGPGTVRRWSAGRKREVVLRLLRGESIDALSREFGVEIYRLEHWRERALAGLDAGLKERESDPVEAKLDEANLRTAGGNVHVVLAFNPSHLEIVDAVVEGSVRARQEQRGDATGATILPLLIHGDAAFAGQGVVMETLQLSQARGFSTGGSLHLVVNNQVGFTTSEPADARSTLYCSDVTKMIEAPIFHVNADDPEAVVSSRALRWPL